MTKAQIASMIDHTLLKATATPEQIAALCDTAKALHTASVCVNPCHVGRLPVQLAAMNQTNINVQLLTIEAARTRDRNYIYQAAMLDPHTAAELSVDDIRSMCDELIEAHGEYMAMYR